MAEGYASIFDLGGLSLTRGAGSAPVDAASLSHMHLAHHSTPRTLAAVFRQVCVALLLSVLASTALARKSPRIAPAIVPTEAPYEVRATIQALAGSAATSVSFYRVHYWTPLDERTLVLWLGREEPYLIKLREVCTGYARDRVLRLSDFQRPGRNKLRVRWSSVFTREGRACTLSTIQPLDLEGMRRLPAPYALPGEKDAPADR